MGPDEHEAVCSVERTAVPLVAARNVRLALSPRSPGMAAIAVALVCELLDRFARALGADAPVALVIEPRLYGCHVRMRAEPPSTDPDLVPHDMAALLLKRLAYDWGYGAHAHDVWFDLLRAQAADDDLTGA